MPRFISVVIGVSVYFSSAILTDLHAQQADPVDFPPEIVLEQRGSIRPHQARDCGRLLEILEPRGALADKLFDILILEAMGCDIPALAIARDIVARPSESEIAGLRALLLTYIAAKQYDRIETNKARLNLDEAFELLTNEGGCFATATRVFALRVKSNLEFAKRDPGKAKAPLDQAFAQARALAEQGPDCAAISPIHKARVFETKAYQAVAAGEDAKARKAFEKALDLYANAKRPVAEMHVLYALAEMTDGLAPRGSSDYRKQAEAIREKLIRKWEKGQTDSQSGQPGKQQETATAGLWRFLDYVSVADPIGEYRPK